MVVPRYIDLPELNGAGYRCSWDYFNSLSHDGKDRIGTLNFLTPERRVTAARETILTGRTISLDLPIDFFTTDISAFGGRSAPSHTIKKVAPFACEDSIDFNTQSTSQWDGLRHFGFRNTGKYYNGYNSSDFDNTDILGTQEWVKKGGISGRCVLIDFANWVEQKGERLEVNSGRRIKLEEVNAILEFQKSTVKHGDILLFRTGWIKWYQGTKSKERHEELCIRNAPGMHQFIGLEPSPAFVEWLWDNQVAAVAGDQVAFESTPPPDTGFGWLHEHLLAGLGCPIGELWNTEDIAQACRATGRYEFFLMSSPLHLPGGVASPANAFALM